MQKLIVLLEEAAVAHELTEDLITIGRAPENAIQIGDPSVSGRHAQLRLVEQRYQLTDLDSTNGTQVNDAAITETFLRPGDRLRFGKIEARFESDAATEAQPLPLADEIVAQPATISAKPADFANASPFPSRATEKDPLKTGVMAAAAVAILAFLVAMLGLLQIHGPR